MNFYNIRMALVGTEFEALLETRPDQAVRSEK